MSESLEAAGALATAGLAAGAIDQHHPGHASSPAHANCANCQAPLDGPYCKMCGQSAHIHHSLLHLAEEVGHGVMHFDAKGWRTIPLLMFFPGRLTRRYIDGQRTNYVSPLALFLFMVFLSFFAASFSRMNVSQESLAPMTPVEREAKIARMEKSAASVQKTIVQAEAALLEARNAGKNTADLQSTLDEARERDESLRSRLKALHEVSAAPAVPVAKTPEERAERQKTNAAKLAEYLRSQGGVTSTNVAVEKAILHALDNPDLAFYKLKNTSYKFSFMLVPISLPFLWLMFFWKRNVTMYAHAVFALYSLSFMSLLFVLLMLFNIAGWNAPIPWLVSFIPPVHMFVQLRGTYQLSIWGASWRTVVLLFAALFVSILFVLFVLMMSMG